MENNQNKTLIIAITLGPISRAIEMAQSTKELWAASYFFSYLAKKLIEPFNQEQTDDFGFGKREFLLPWVDMQKMSELKNGAGLFPDRYIFKVKQGDIERFNTHADDVLKEISFQIAIIKDKPKDAETIFNYLKSFIKIYALVLTFETDDTYQIISTCEKHLNMIEQQDTFPAKLDQDLFYQLIRNVNGKAKRSGDKLLFKGSFLSKDAFDKSDGKRLFASTLEISAAEIFKGLNLIISSDEEQSSGTDWSLEGEDIQEIQFLENVLKQKQTQQNIYPYHKYIAIVKADGDSLGKTLSNMSDKKEAIHNLSQALFEFNKQVIELISNYGGKAVFAGGDDLLFFAPVYNEEKNIFGLIADISKEFDKQMNEHLKHEGNVCNEKPTLSFGMSMTYYKYPMFEALETANNRLEVLAKDRIFQSAMHKLNVPDNEFNRYIQKNKLAFALQKHSGQSYDAVLWKGGTAYEKFNQLITDYCSVENSANNQNNTESKNDFLHSVIWKLKNQREMILFILRQDKPNENKILLDNFFANNFNETCHDAYTKFFDNVKDLLLELYKETKTASTDRNQFLDTYKLDERTKKDLLVCPATKALDTLLSTLHFIHFINSKQ